MALTPRSQKLVGFAGRPVAPVGPGSLPVRFVLRLQQTVGNREVERLLVARPAPGTALVRSSTQASQRPRRASAMERIARWWRRLSRRPAPAQDGLPGKPPGT